MWNLFKVINKETRTTSKRHSVIFIDNLEHISCRFYCSLRTGKCLLESGQVTQIESRQTRPFEMNKISNYIRKSLHMHTSRTKVFYKRLVLKISQNSQENTCAKVFFLIKFQVSQAQVFYCEFYEVFKSTEHLFCRTPLVAASVRVCKLKRIFLATTFIHMFVTFKNYKVTL